MGSAVASDDPVGVGRRGSRVITPPYGYIAYWPDPGAETRKYGDRMICALVGPGKGQWDPAPTSTDSPTPPPRCGTSGPASVQE
jgi:hypothetical protein